jgi:hypothetical protein
MLSEAGRSWGPATAGDSFGKQVPQLWEQRSRARARLQVQRHLRNMYDYRRHGGQMVITVDGQSFHRVRDSITTGTLVTVWRR